MFHDPHYLVQDQNHPLRATEQPKVAEWLTGKLIEATLATASLTDVADKEPLGEDERAARKSQLEHLLKDMAAALHPNRSHVDDPESRKRNLRVALHNYFLPEELAAFQARLGHIEQMAGLVARDNLFTQMRKNRVPVAGGAEELLRDPGRFATAEQAVEALAKPVFGLTFTAHPTNVNGLASIKAQRALLQAIDDVREGRDTRTDAPAITEAMEHYAATPLMHEGKLTVRDETAQMLHTLGNVYDDLPHIYQRFDDPLAARFKTRYRPETLKLGIDLSSWGSSGDKDGNANVTADTTLEAMAQHKRAVLQRYARDLEPLTHPALAPWKERIGKALAAAETALETCHGHAPFLPPQAWENATRALAAARLDKDAFIADLENAYAERKDGATLDLLRRARVFGFGMGRLEYRETAEIYRDITALFVPGYGDMDEPQRIAALNGLLAAPTETLQHTHAALLETIRNAGGKPYSSHDPLPIAHHTLKRMELARDFPEMVSHNVLAECQNTSNFLEALLMQKLAGKEGREPQLGVVPLFEEYQVLERAGGIMKDALTNPHYRTHVTALAARDGKPTQQIQLAHSDNARRAGMPAARAYIYDAHTTLRKAVEERGVAVQFFEGGSQSDPYRGGVRSMTAGINEFGIHDFAKFTFQGGDLLNHLNYPSSSIRLFTRHISHAADVLDRQAKQQGAGDHARAVLNRRSVRRDFDPALDATATAALKRTVRDYVDKIFINPEFGDFLKSIGYLEETEAGSKTSRAANRGAPSTEVDVEKTRTIAFAEAFEHAGICPTWIGSQNLYTYLCRESHKALSAKELNDVYKASPVFTDVVDRMLFGLARSDFTRLTQALDKTPGNSLMLRDLRLEYRHALKLAMQARTGQTLEQLGMRNLGDAGFDTLRQLVVEKGLPHLKEPLTRGDAYLQQIECMRDILAPNNGHAGEREKHLRSLLHCAGDTVHHGRILPADDHTYGQLLGCYEAALKAKAPQPYRTAHEHYLAQRNGTQAADITIGK